MNKSSFTLFLIAFLPFIAPAQSDNEVDELCSKICVSIQNSTAASDQEKVESAFEEHIPTFIEVHELTVVDDLLDKVYFRLQKLCPTFVEMLNASNQALENGDWEIVTTQPAITLTKK